MKSIMELLEKGFFILLSVLLGIPAIVAAEVPPKIQWQKSFGGSTDDSLQALRQTSDGGFIVGGASKSVASGNKTSMGHGGLDYWVLKLDTDGNKIWEKSFGGSGNDELRAVQQTSEGGYILGGFSDSAPSGNKSSVNYGDYDFWVLKLDASGNKMWETSLGGTGEDRLSALQQTSDGGYILGGFSYSTNSGTKTSTNYPGDFGRPSQDWWVVKLDANGNELWEKTYGGTNGEVLHAIQQTADGGYLLGGESTSGISGNKTTVNFGGSDYWVINLNPAGDKVWEKSFGGTGESESCWSAQQTSDGGYIVGGVSASIRSGNKTSANFDNPPGNGGDFWVIKLDSNGDKIWENSFGGDSSDGIFSIQPTSGGYILAGYSASGVYGNKTSPRLGAFGTFDCWVLKIDLNGNKMWEASYGGNDSDYFFGIQRTSNGFILGGDSRSGVSGNKTSPNYGALDFWIVKLENPPVITTQPQSQSVAIGAPVSFSVLVDGVPPFSYQWLFNGSAILGASAPTLTLLNTTYGQAGLYSVVVQDDFGSVTSAVAQLAFNFLRIDMYAGITIDGQVGQNYRLEYAPTLGGQTNWQTLTNVTLTNTSYLFIDLDSPRSPRRFYRALLSP